MLLHHLSLADVATATQGRWITAPANPERALPPISTDTRTIDPGDLYLALRGANFDGHNYLEQALEAGASGLVVAESAQLPQDIARRFGDVFILSVRDTLEALGDIANTVRKQATGTEVIGIVGSSGKTTVKEMLAAILRAHVGVDRVLATEANLNNLIGVPKMLLKLEQHHEFAVLEAGMNQPGELARLSVIVDADTTLVTNIGSAHRGNFASAEEHVRAKLDWPLHATPHRRIFLNVDGGQLDRLREASTHLEATLYGIDHDESQVWARAIEPMEPYGYRFEIVVGEDVRIPVSLRLFGAQNISNALAAASVAWTLGVAPQTITAALGELEPTRWRGELIEIAGRRIVLDHYNATPEAVVQSVHSMVDVECRGRRVAVLGSMLELGDTAPRAHRRVGRAVVAAGLDALYTIGDDMMYAHEAVRGQQCDTLDARHADSMNELAAIVAHSTKPGDLLLLKGSRSMKMERILPLLEEALAATAIPA